MHLKALEILALWISICEDRQGVVNILQNISVEKENIGMGGAKFSITSVLGSRIVWSRKVGGPFLKKSQKTGASRAKFPL